MIEDPFRHIESDLSLGFGLIVKPFFSMALETLEKKALSLYRFKKTEILFLGFLGSLLFYFCSFQEPQNLTFIIIFIFLLGFPFFKREKAFCKLIAFIFWGASLGLCAVFCRIETHPVELLETPLNPQYIEGEVRQIIPRTPYSSDLRLSNYKRERRSSVHFQGDILLRNAPLTNRLHIGQKVKGLISLYPLPLPLEPGGYPRTQELYFQGYAAVGVLKGQLSLLGEKPPSWRQKHRFSLLETLEKKFSSPTGGILTALILGEKGLIPATVKETFALSGLSHLLAISGLHMSLVALFLFFLTRRFFSLFSFTETTDTKPLAAVITWIFLLYYLLLCFDALSARRAFIMSSVFLLSTLLKQRVFSLKNLVFSAFIILIFWPEAIIMPGFQLSFSAVFGILFMTQLPFWKNLESPSSRLNPWLKKAIITPFLTSLAATLATLPLILKSFHHWPIFAVFSNLIAIPLMNLLIMPLAILSLPFWQINLSLADQALSFSINLLVSWASYVQTAPISANTPSTPLLFCALASAIFPFLSRRPRLWHAVPFCLTSLLFFFSPAPDIFLTHQRPYLAIYHQKSLYLPLGSSNFPVRLWLNRTNAKDIYYYLPPEQAEKRGIFSDEDALLVKKNTQQILFINDPRLRPPQHTKINLIIERYNSKQQRAHLLSLGDLRSLGACDLYIDARGIKLHSPLFELGHRPWNPYKKKIPHLQKKLEKLI